MDVSIILVSYNTKELTRNALKSIFEKTTGVDFDVWVVDNASQDGSSEMIKEEFHQIKLIDSKENLGFGRANNLAVGQSNAKYVFLLNTDTILINNAVKILFDFMEKPENSNVGACGGNLYDENMNNIHSFGEFPSVKKQLFTALFLHKVFKNIVISDSNEFNEYKIVDYITGADLMLRKSALNETGLFDDRFFMYGEELELQYRLKEAGYSSTIIPDSKIIHLCGKSYNNNLKHYFDLDKSKLLFLQIHKNKTIKDSYKFALLLWLLLRFIIAFYKRNNNHYLERIRNLAKRET